MTPLYGIPAERVAAMTGAHLTTARRWKRAARLPLWLTKLCRLLIDGELEEISGTFAGWRIHCDELVSPEGWRFTPGDVRSLPFLRQQLAHAKARARLPAQGDWISGDMETLPGALRQDAAPRPVAVVVPLSAPRGAQPRPPSPAPPLRQQPPTPAAPRAAVRRLPDRLISQ